MGNLHKIRRSIDTNAVSMVDDTYAKCRLLMVKCQIGNHENIINAYLFAATTVDDNEDNRFVIKTLFRDAAHILHDSLPEHASAWFDRVTATGSADIHDVVLDEIREDISSGAFHTLEEFKTALENACGLDTHPAKDRLFGIAERAARFATPFHTLALEDVPTMFQYAVANRYVDAAMMLVPSITED